MKEEKEVETKEDTDSGNNTADSCSDCEERKSLLTPLEGKEEEVVEEEKEDDGGLVEAQKPKFSSPVWLEDIHTNKLFNKQKSILTEEVSIFCPEKPKSWFIDDVTHLELMSVIM